MSKFWNDKKFLGISSFYTCAAKLQSYDRIFCHFAPFFAHLTPSLCIPLLYQDKIRALFEIATAFGHTIILRLEWMIFFSSEWLMFSFFLICSFIRTKHPKTFCSLGLEEFHLRPCTISTETALKTSHFFYLRFSWQKGLFQVQIIIFFWKTLLLQTLNNITSACT